MLLLTVVPFMFGCPPDPGGTVGDNCEDIGLNDECEDDEICDAVADGYAFQAYCLRLCDSQDDCDPNEQCNGLTSANGKACHPL